MPGMGSPGMMGGGMGMQQGPHAGTAQNPVGAPPSIVGEGFSQPGTLPSPDSSLISKPSNTVQNVHHAVLICDQTRNFVPIVDLELNFWNYCSIILEQHHISVQKSCGGRNFLTAF